MSTIEDVRRAFDTLHARSRLEPYPTLEVRLDRLERLDRLMVRHQEDFIRAMNDDFGVRARVESLSADVMLVVDAARHARRHLAEWMRRRHVGTHPLFAPSDSFVEPQPKGVVGVIAPWNYPVNLALAPVAAALAAGNRVLVKPSELTPRTASLMARAVADFFAGDEVVVVEGGVEVAQAVSALPLDHLLFTGSTAVGRLVARAAAENLTPVTLELGGKSPALVHETYDLSLAAERVAVGKVFNSGQTCIAPDYALVPAGHERRFAEAFASAIRRLCPEPSEVTSLASDKGRARFESLLADARQQGAEVVGDAAFSGRSVRPVAVLGATASMRVMQEELFCPILPVEGYQNLEEALARISSRPRPLAFYYFDADLNRTDGVLRRVVCGGACVNDTLHHFAQETLPFGGIGDSGMGAYHGEAGFVTFSHQRSVLVASRVSAARTFMTPPYGKVVNTTLDVIVRGVRALRGTR